MENSPALSLRPLHRPFGAPDDDLPRQGVGNPPSLAEAREDLAPEPLQVPWSWLAKTNFPW